MDARNALMDARNRTPAWLIRAWVDQRVTMREALELRPYAWVLGRPELHGIRQGGGGTPPRGGAAKDPPGADPYAAPGLREVPEPVTHEDSMSLVVCDHVFEDPRRDACSRCGVTGTEIAVGRDRLPSWESVDDAYERGFHEGYRSARRAARERRRRSFLLGARWALRRLDVREDSPSAGGTS